MALVVKDRVKQTTTTTGTGSVVLNGTVSGFQTFAAALSNGDTTYYAIFEPSTNEYEVGLGTWTESTATLARTTILESSNSGSAVSLTAQAEVFITQPAEKAVYLDASNNVTLTNNLTVSGDFTVSGTTTTIDTTNSVVTDSLIELSNGTTGTPANDAGIVIERGDSDNAFIGYDESADKFTVGTGSFTGASTGNLTISTGTLVANVEGNLTGNVTGNVSGSSGSTTGNAATATALQTARTIAGQSFDGTANITIAPTDLTGVTSTAAELNILDGVTSTTAELNLLDGVTATTTELNYVDGVTSAIQTQLDAKAPINNPTFTGSISHAGDLTIDVGGDITLDAGGQNIRLKDDGTEFGQLLQDSNNFVLYSSVSDADMIFKGNDGGVITTALTLDMSDAGTAIFNHDIKLADNGKAIFGAGSDLQIYHDGSHSYISDQGTGNLRILAGEFNVKSASGNTDLIYAVNGGAVTLYNNGNAKIATTSTGVDVTGTVTADGLTVDKTDTATYSSTAIDDTFVITRKNSSGTNNQVVGIEFDVTQASGVTTGVAGISAVQPTNISSADLVFQTRNAGTIGERLRITSDGNVGINQSSPDEALVVVGDLKVDTGSNAGVIHFGDVSDQTKIVGFDSTGTIANTLLFTTGTNERMRIDSSGRLLLNTTVEGYTDYADDFTISNTSGRSGMTIRSGNTSQGSIFFSDSNANSGAGAYAGYVTYIHSSDSLQLGSGSAERMRIDSSGNLLVGRTSTSDTNVGGMIRPDGFVQSTRDGNIAADFNRNTSDGGIVRFSKGSSPVGSIATEQGDLVIGTGDTGVKFNDNLNSIYPYHTDISNGSQDNSIDIGYSTVRFRNAYLAGSLSDGTTSRTVADIVGTTSSQFLRSDAADTATGTITVATGTDPAIIAKSDDWGEQLEILRNHATNWPSVKFSNTSGEKGRVFVDTSNNNLMYVKAGGSNYETVWTSLTDGSGSGLDADLLDGYQGAVSATANTVAIRQGSGYIYATFFNGSGTFSTSGTTSGMGLFTGTNGSDTFGRSYTAAAARTLLNVEDGATADQSASEILTAIKTVDGSGSGLDADTLDGNHAVDFQYRKEVGFYVAGDADKFYKVSIPVNQVGDHIKVYRHYNWSIGGSSSYWNSGSTTHFGALMLDVKILTNQWGGQRDYISGNLAHNYTVVAGRAHMGIGSEYANIIVYLRGGAGGSGAYYQYELESGSTTAPTVDYNTYITSADTEYNYAYANYVLNDNVSRVYRNASELYDAGNEPQLGYIDTATGDYGTIKVDDDRGTGWAGYAIQDDWVFMGRADDVGIYNDTDNEWVLYAVRNGETYLYYDNAYKLNTTSGGVLITGALSATSDITAYYSDERLKNFEGKIDGALDKVSKLSGYYFRENEKAKELGYENDARQVGVSAQEVEAVMPEVVKPAPVDPEYKTVQYEKLVPLLIEAIKELKEEVRQLKEDKA